MQSRSATRLGERERTVAVAARDGEHLGLGAALRMDIERPAKRTIQLVHMPVPRARTDDAYYEPLADLDLLPETKVALGLVHYTDGVDGTRKRIAVAEKYRAEFAVSTECGFGRRDPETIVQLLQIHAEVVGLRE
jgi:hypothetical protein